MTALRLEGISKHFGAIHALNDVSMSLSAGEVVGLMGDNGAGKSTLVKIIAGNYRPTHGKIFIKDRETTFHRPVEARQNGIEIVYQDLALCDNLSAAVNVFLGRELTRSIGPFKILDYAGDERGRGSTVQGPAVGNAAEGHGPLDVGRTAAGRRDRPHAAQRRRNRADGRADRRDLGAPGGGGAQPHPRAAGGRASPWY